MKRNYNYLFGFLVMAAGIASTTAAVAASAYHYRMRGIAPIAGTSCDEYAWQTGERLAEYASRSPQGPGRIQVVDSACFSDVGDSDNQGWNIDVTYEADKPLQKVSTTSTDGSLTHLPGYKTAEACEAALISEIPLFERKTGLRAFSSWCRVPTYTRSWQLNIEAFGQPELRPFVAGANIFGKIMGHDMASFESLIRERFAAQNAEVVQLELQPGFAYHELGIRFYGSKSIRMVDNVVVKTATVEECLDQLRRLDTNLIAKGVVTYGTFCTTGTPGTAFELMSLTEKTESIRLSHPDETFEDFSACYAQRDAIAELYRTRYRRNVIDAVCGYNRDAKAYKVVVVDKPVAAEI